MFSTHYLKDQLFFYRFSIVLSVFIIACFALHALRGIADYTNAPLWLHLHGIVSVSWLILFVVQNHLALSNSIDLHRKLGRFGGVLVILMFVLGVNATINSLLLNRVPPIFEPSYFLALGVINISSFFLVVLWAIIARKNTHLHRRLMLFSTIILLEPALGRFLPYPLLMDYFPWAQRACQLLVIGVVAFHDIKFYGKAHIVWLYACLIVVASHLTILMLSKFQPFVELSLSMVNR
ncbi:adenylate cyclase [Thalassotalea sp. LPB0316]|uniref:adenylate cyclase n=1 Tax=Thalassotalea sp. LPB0316 TaxID=2769490 RepID=UPI0018696891|nr:adenylate cyclase [Thalassotalea sp. LPB0316]QOL25226.1 adenylate cyclase [Thalassotalea sp. LPB0316]